MASHWLVKQEPSAYPFARLLEEGSTAWDGVRNPQARISLRAMRRGDAVLYYHSGDEKAVVGLARVEREAFPDPAAPEWVAVELAAMRALRRAVTLADIKASADLADLALVKQSRLSVMPVSEEHFAMILALAGEGCEPPSGDAAAGEGRG